MLQNNDQACHLRQVIYIQTIGSFFLFRRQTIRINKVYFVVMIFGLHSLAECC